MNLVMLISLMNLVRLNIACLILLVGHIEPILHFEDYSMLVWMVDTNMFDWEH